MKSVMKMNEYNLEKTKGWMTELHCQPKTGIVSKLLAKIPKPKESKLKYSLPSWDEAPLYNKLPDLGIRGMNYTRGRAGASVLKTSDNVGFITYDPHCYEHDSRKYDSLHDKHLSNYFKSKRICKFLRRVGILDKENFPKSSLRDMNEYRHYLNRIHSDKVKKEHVKLLNQAYEKLLWKRAQERAIKNYFKRFIREEILKKNSAKKKQFLRLQRAKELEPYERLKRWDQRIEKRAQQQKDNDMMREELVRRRRTKYEHVITKCKAIERDKLFRTKMIMRKKRISCNEVLKKRKQLAEQKANQKAELYKQNKTNIQKHKIQKNKEINIFQENGKCLNRQREQLITKREQQKFNDQLKCRKLKKIKPKAIIEVNKFIDPKLKYLRKEKTGIDYLIKYLNEFNIKKTQIPIIQSKLAQINKENFISKLIKKITQQMIRRTLYCNLQLACKYLVSTLLNYYLIPSIEYLTGNNYPVDQCKCAMGIQDGDEIKELVEVNQQTVCTARFDDNETLNKETINSGNKDIFFTKKQQLLSTILKNAKILFNLVDCRINLLLTVGDQYKDLPKLNEDLNKFRKEYEFTELINRLTNLLTTSDNKRFLSPLSDIGRIANLLACTKIVYNTSEDNIATETAETKLNSTTLTAFNKGDDEMKNTDNGSIKNDYLWNCVLELYNSLKMECERLERERAEAQIEEGIQSVH